MLQSVTIQKRQSAIRQELAALVGKEKLDENETRSLSNLEAEYGQNEGKYRAALIVEDEQRAEAKGDLETRSDREFADIVSKFEMRQVALALDEGKPLDGATKEVVDEMRASGGYQGIPVPWMALERRTGETVASGVPSPTNFAPIIDRLFPQSVSARMGAQMVSIAQGTNEYPLTSSSVAAGWASTETGAVAGPTVYSTSNRALSPANTLGIQMKLTRKTLKQSGPAIEDAVRRDISGAVQMKLDAATFLGAGSSGEPLGVIPGQSTYAYTTTAVSDVAAWSVFRTAVTTFISGNAANAPADVRVLLRPEIYNFMDDDILTGTAVSEWDLLVKHLGAGNVTMTSNALAAPTGTPKASTVVLTTSAGGVAPVYIGTWGGVDLIRDVYSDAASGMLRLTALVTADVTVGRKGQVMTLTGVESEASA